MRSRLILHPTKFYSSPIDRVAYYFLMHSIVFINSGLSLIETCYILIRRLLHSLVHFIGIKPRIILALFEPCLEGHYIDVLIKPEMCCLYNTVDRFYQCQYIFVRVVCFK